MPAKRKPGIYCVEGEWSPRRTERTSVAPLLDFLDRVDRIDSVHRQVATLDAFEFDVRRWGERQYERYPIGYFAFHGSPGVLHVGRKRVTLTRLAEILDGACQGRLIYFGSCETLAVPKAEIDAFRKATGARAVLGYTEYIDWMESAAFELVLFDALTLYSRPGDVRRWMTSNHLEFCKRLGFVISYSGARSSAL